jgi:polyisoprenoid-binding protein YceI
MLQNTIANFFGLKKHAVVLLASAGLFIWSNPTHADTKASSSRPSKSQPSKAQPSKSQPSKNPTVKASDKGALKKQAPEQVPPGGKGTPSQPYEIDYADSKIEFISYTSLFPPVFGTFKKWSLNLTGNRGHLDKVRSRLEIDTASLDTGIEARDEHLRSSDFFDCEKYPKAVFELKGTKVKGTTAPNEGPVPLQVIGLLEFRGRKAEVAVDTTLEEIDHGKSYVLTGTAMLNRQEWGVRYVASFPLPSIKDQVDVKFKISFKPAHRQDH